MHYIDIFKPAINLFNGFRFPQKIISIFTILLIPLLFLSGAFIWTTLQEKRVYLHQQRALQQIEILQQLISQIQLHRGVLSLSPNRKYHQPIRIRLNEMSIENIFYQLKEDDSLRQLYKRFEKIELNHSATLQREELFSLHTQIIASLIEKIKTIAQESKMEQTPNRLLNQLAYMLTNELLTLQEATAQFRGAVSPLMASAHLSYQEKSILLTYYTSITTLTKSPLTSTLQSHLHHHIPALQKIKSLLDYQLENILAIARNRILLEKSSIFNSDRFFQLLTDTIQTESKLFTETIQNYDQLLKQQEDILNQKIALVISMLLGILLLLLYLGHAFYLSVTKSIKQLQLASQMVGRGETLLYLQSESRDEIADTLHAFNKMSERLQKNISFLNSYKLALDHSSIVSKTDLEGNFTYVNKTFCQISGYSMDELLGKSHNIIRHPRTPQHIIHEMWQTIQSGKIWRGYFTNSTKTGESYSVNATIVPILDQYGNNIEYVSICHDITELEEHRESLKKEIERQKIDPLTKLPMRIKLLEDLKECHRPVLLYLDIDNFSGLNEFYGIQMGDKVLMFVTKLLHKKCTAYTCRLYKLQSDGFVLLLEQSQTAKRPETILHEIIEWVEGKTKQCDDIECVSLTLTGSIADYTLCQEENFTNLLSYLVSAKKIAKREHKKFLTYQRNLHVEEEYQNNIHWINKIKEALDEGRIVTYFQPIVNTKTAKIEKYEALVRLIERDGKVISPFFFLDIAKKAKLYTQITKAVVIHTFTTFASRPELEFSLNITVEDIHDKDITNFILKQIEIFPHPHRIILEITETENIEDYRPVNHFVQQVKKFGVQIAIDDFGSGYSNFAHIIGLNADFIKIDGSLIKNIDTSHECQVTTKAIIAFTKQLGTKSIAEFVHNESVYQQIIAMGADYAQGYYLGEPSSQLLQEQIAQEA